MRARAAASVLVAALWLAASACGGSGPSAESTAAGAGFRAPDSPIVNLYLLSERPLGLLASRPSSSEFPPIPA